MDISKIKGNEVKAEHGIKVGDPSAPVKVMEYINLACPYCHQWFENSFVPLQQFVNEGKVQRIVKLFDKDKPGLKKGNILHEYLDYNGSEKTLDDILFLFDHQSDWNELDEEGIRKYAEEERGLTRQDNSQEAKSIVEEAEKANVTMVPSVFIGEQIFDESVTEDELIGYIEDELSKERHK